MKIEWIRCPICGSKTRNKIRGDTVLKNYPLYCPKCKQEVLIEIKDLQMTVIRRIDAEPMNSGAIIVHRLSYYIAASPPNKKNGVLVGCIFMP